MIKSDSTDITWIQAQPYCFQHWMTIYISGNLHCANKLTTQTKFFTWRNNEYTYNFKLILILKDNAWSHSSSIKKKKKAHSKMDCSIWGCTDHLHSTQGQCWCVKSVKSLFLLIWFLLCATSKLLQCERNKENFIITKKQKQKLKYFTVFQLFTTPSSISRCKN